MTVAREWLATASDDLRAAEAFLSQLAAFPRQTCYHAQQAAEKAVKAVLAAEGLTFPKSHDLVELIALLPAGQALAALAVDWAALSDWAVRGRYPGTGPAAAPAEAQRAIADARLVVQTADADLCRG
jgi:HEPN domain-containing protein